MLYLCVYVLVFLGVIAHDYCREGRNMHNIHLLDIICSEITGVITNNNK